MGALSTSGAAFASDSFLGFGHHHRGGSGWRNLGFSGGPGGGSLYHQSGMGTLAGGTAGSRKVAPVFWKSVGCGRELFGHGFSPLAFWKARNGRNQAPSRTEDDHAFGWGITREWFKTGSEAFPEPWGSTLEICRLDQHHQPLQYCCYTFLSSRFTR